jgi:hypothetical protein
MGLLDTLLGRTKPVAAKLDALFSLPSAAITLQSAADITGSGEAGVCVKPAASGSFEEAEREIRELLSRNDSEDDGAALAGSQSELGAGAGAASGGAAGTSLQNRLRVEKDEYGYQWLVVSNPSLEDLVTEIHMVNTTLSEAGWSQQLLCSVFGLSVPEGPTTSAERAYLVYLYKRGTFYPFVPVGSQKRDNELELRLRSLVEGDLPIETDLSRWFPLWGLPVH